MKIKRLLSAGILAAMVTISVGTVAKASNYQVYYGYYTFSDFSEAQITNYENKDSLSSIFINYIWGTSQGDNRMQFGTMGAYDNYGTGATDVSNGYYYVLNTGDSREDIYNWVNEWGYNYAAIRVSTMGDSAVNMEMFWQLDQ